MAIDQRLYMMMCREYKRAPFSGPALFLGRQRAELLALAQAQQVVRDTGLTPAELPADFDTRPNIPYCRTLNETNDEALVRLLGCDEVHAMDYSEYEGADIIHDLNDPIPEELANRFGLIVDSGTIEHIFDTRQVMRNIGNMLKPGGRVIHFTPANNAMEHGFFQMSPTFFADFYGENGFTDVDVWIVIQPRDCPPGKPLRMFQYDRKVFGGSNSVWSSTEDQIFLNVSATKTATSTTDRIPVQFRYLLRYQEFKQGSAPYQFPLFLVRWNGADCDLVQVAQ